MRRTPPTTTNDISCLRKMAFKSGIFEKTIPVELVGEICQYLDLKDLLNLSEVNIFWRNSVNIDRIWKQICINDFNVNPTEKPLIELKCRVEPAFRVQANKSENLNDLCPWRIRYHQEIHVLKNWKNKRFYKESCPGLQSDDHSWKSNIIGNNLIVILADEIRIYRITDNGLAQTDRIKNPLEGIMREVSFLKNGFILLQGHLIAYYVLTNNDRFELKIQSLITKSWQQNAPLIMDPAKYNEFYVRESRTVYHERYKYQMQLMQMKMLQNHQFLFIHSSEDEEDEEELFSHVEEFYDEEYFYVSDSCSNNNYFVAGGRRRCRWSIAVWDLNKLETFSFSPEIEEGFKMSQLHLLFSVNAGCSSKLFVNFNSRSKTQLTELIYIFDLKSANVADSSIQIPPLKNIIGEEIATVVIGEFLACITLYDVTFIRSNGDIKVVGHYGLGLEGAFWNFKSYFCGFHLKFDVNDDLEYSSPMNITLIRKDLFTRKDAIAKITDREVYGGKLVPIALNFGLLTDGDSSFLIDLDTMEEIPLHGLKFVAKLGNSSKIIVDNSEGVVYYFW